MPSSSDNESDIQVGGSAIEDPTQSAGQWRLVKPEDLERAGQAAAEDPTASDPRSSVLGNTNLASSPEPKPAPTAPAENKPSKPVLKRRQELEQHLRSNPNDVAAFLELAHIYRNEGRPLDAHRILKQAIEIFPDEPELRWEMEEATLARSLQHFREVTELASRFQTAETDREVSRCQQDWAQRRIEVCRARLGRDPSMVGLRVSLAEALYDAGLYEDAISEAEVASTADEFSPTAHLILGKCLLAIGKDLDAMASLRACALRRAVVAPLRIRVMALRLLCDTAERLGITLTLDQYQTHLRHAETELAKQTGSQPKP